MVTSFYICVGRLFYTFELVAVALLFTANPSESELWFDIGNIV